MAEENGKITGHDDLEWILGIQKGVYEFMVCRDMKVVARGQTQCLHEPTFGINVTDHHALFGPNGVLEDIVEKISK